MQAVALTDIENLYGVQEFTRACSKYNVKPIYGCDIAGTLLIARDMTGYRNLINLISADDKSDEALLKYSKGLFCIAGGVNSRVGKLIETGDISGAEERVKFYIECYGIDRVYLALQKHSIPGNDDLTKEVNVNNKLKRMAKQYSLPLVITHDVYYLNKGDARAHQALLKSESRTPDVEGLTLPVEVAVKKSDRILFEDEHYFASGEEMLMRFPDDREAIENTLRIANQCNVVLPEFQPALPDIPTGESKPLLYLKDLVYQGLIERYKSVTDNIRLRADSELEIIDKCGCANHFLFVHDFVVYARKTGIHLGPGRGNMPGSLVNYALGITDVDPIRYGLKFELFLNPKRPDPEFCIETGWGKRRDLVSYFEEKYGRGSVGLVPVFEKYNITKSIKRAAEYSGIEDTGKVFQYIPEGYSGSLSRLIELNPAIKYLAEQGDKYSDLIDIAVRLEGVKHRTFIHSSAVVISPGPLKNYVALEYDDNGNIIIQCDKHEAVSYGLVVVDILELRELDRIDNSVVFNNIRSDDTGPYHRLPDDDIKTLRVFSSGNTSDIFLFQSQGMVRLLREFQPVCFNDLVLLYSLFSPSFIKTEMPRVFSANKNLKHTGSAGSFYKNNIGNDSLSSILEETRGRIIFKEQIIEILNTLAGFSHSEAVLVYRAMADNEMDKMPEIEGDIIAGVGRNGISEADANMLISWLIDVAPKAACKAHAVAYTWISYQAAYIKAHDLCMNSV